MAREVADQDEQARAMLADLFNNWEGQIAAGLRRMQVDGTLKAGADVDAARRRRYGRAPLQDRRRR